MKERKKKNLSIKQPRIENYLVRKITLEAMAMTESLHSCISDRRSANQELQGIENGGEIAADILT